MNYFIMLNFEETKKVPGQRKPMFKITKKEKHVGRIVWYSRRKHWAFLSDQVDKLKWAELIEIAFKMEQLSKTYQ